MRKRNSWIERRIRVPQAWVHWTQATRWRGFAKLSLYETIVFVIAELRQDDVVAKSQSIAFTLFISVFPALLVIFTLLPHLPISIGVIDTLEDYIYSVLPGQSSKLAMDLIRDILERPRGGLLSFSFILALYFSSNGIMRLMRAFDKASYRHTFLERSIVETRLIALALTAALSGQLLLSLALATFGTEVSLYLQEVFGLNVGSRLLISALQYLLIGGFIYVGIAIVFRYGAATVTRFPFFTPGAFLATGMILLTSLGFAVYVNNLDSINKLYGSIGTVLIFLIWLQLNILWILIGYELNAGIAVMRNVKTMDRANAETFT